MQPPARQRRSTRRRPGSPLAALVIPAALGGAAWLLHTTSSSAATGAASFVLAVLAAPGLLIAGVPLRGGNSVAIGIAISAAVWLVLGLIARQRARNGDGRRGAFWRHYGWLAAGVWAGVAVAGLISNVLIGRILL
jgi:hypothetical protein